MISLICGVNCRVYYFLGNFKLAKKLMILTTAWTEAEATPNAIIDVPEKEFNVGIVNDNMIADYVILDAIIIKKLSIKIVA